MLRRPLVLLILMTSILLSACSTVETLKFSAEASVDAMKSSMVKTDSPAGCRYRLCA